MIIGEQSLMCTTVGDAKVELPETAFWAIGPRGCRFAGVFTAVVLALTCSHWSTTRTAAACQQQRDWPAVGMHPENPRYLLFRGKPLVLIAATEHYGSVLNRPFDYVAYLDDLAKKKLTLTRTFLLFRELQSASNPYSTCKPESADYIAPWPRSGVGKALDNESKYDLDRWNPEFFERLQRFLADASKRGIVVELTLFSCTYRDNIWALNPLRAENNLQGIGKCACRTTSR